MLLAMKPSLLIALALCSFSFSAHAFEGRHQNEEFNRRWTEYVAEAESVPLQKECKPRLYEASDKVPFQGTIVLHHGFTACPQQFFELADQFLSQIGYDVVLPVLPGHGREWTGKKNNQNDLRGMPTRENWKTTLGDYVRKINQLMGVSAGTKVISGLSFGGAIAAEAMLEEPKLYARALLFSPFFSISKTNPWKKFPQITNPLNESKAYFADYLSRPNTALYSSSLKKIGWGDGCTKTERSLGRAGYCQFSINSISAYQQFGDAILARMKTAHDLPRTQIVAVEQDPVADTKLTRDYDQLLRKASKIEPAICFFRNDTNHSLLSRFDNPSEDKYWIPFLLSATTRFVESGVPVQTAGPTPDENNYPVCAVPGHTEFGAVFK
jgi:alpha-beta hydrolase superfamily lysophospholipase